MYLGSDQHFIYHCMWQSCQNIILSLTNLLNEKNTIHVNKKNHVKRHLCSSTDSSSTLIQSKTVYF